MPGFQNEAESHDHSLRTLKTLYEFDDLMQSIQTVVDMGAGTGLDLAWWATRTTRDEQPGRLNIRCTAVDQRDRCEMAQQHKNITYHRHDFEQPFRLHKKLFDVIWCHDSFQYVIDPFRTLAQWREICDPGGMMVLIVPQMTNLEFNVQAFDQQDGVYWNWTTVSLMHVLAVSGWDCRSGFWKKDPDDAYIHAIVYNTDQPARDPRVTRWYDLAAAGLLPDSAMASIQKHGYLRQRDLVLKWIDRSVRSLAQH